MCVFVRNSDKIRDTAIRPAFLAPEIYSSVCFLSGIFVAVETPIFTTAAIRYVLSSDNACSPSIVGLSAASVFLSNVIARANTERRSLWISSRFGLNQTHATVSICRIFCNGGGDGGPGNIGRQWRRQDFVTGGK